MKVFIISMIGGLSLVLTLVYWGIIYSYLFFIVGCAVGMALATALSIWLFR